MFLKRRIIKWTVVFSYSEMLYRNEIDTLQMSTAMWMSPTDIIILEDYNKMTGILHTVKILIHNIRDTYLADVTIKKKEWVDQHKFKVVIIFWGEWDFC